MSILLCENCQNHGGDIFSHRCVLSEDKCACPSCRKRDKITPLMLDIVTTHAESFMRRLFLYCVGINGCVTNLEQIWASREKLVAPSLFEEWIMLPFIAKEIKERIKQAEEHSQLLW